MILHAWRCQNPKCGEVFDEFTEYNDEAGRLEPVPCRTCRSETQVCWMNSNYPNAHPHDRTVIFENPKNGDWTAPDTNTTEMSKRLRDRGYVKREFTSLRELEKFEKTSGFHNEGAHYDNGSGSTRFDGERGA